MASIARFWHAVRAVRRQPGTTYCMQDTSTLVLWTIEDVASFYRRSVRQARRIVRLPGFPAHARGDRYRWAANAVIAFATTATTATVVETSDMMGPTGIGNRIVRNRQRVMA